MAKMTLQNKFIAALRLEGYEFVNNPRTSKFVVFKNPANGMLFYIGKSGALRFGANIANSIPVSDKHKAFLLSRLKALNPPNQE